MTNTITLTDEQLADLNAGKSITIDPPQQRGLREGQWVWCTGVFPNRWVRLGVDDGDDDAVYDVPRIEDGCTYDHVRLPKGAIDWSRGIHDEKPVEKWEPKGGGWTCLVPDGSAERHPSMERFAAAGLERDRKGHADRASKKLRQYARLLAWRDEHCPYYVEPKNGVPAWYVVFDGHEGWWTAVPDISRGLTDVPMPQWAAKQLAHDLNTGKVEL